MRQRAPAESWRRLCQVCRLACVSHLHSSLEWDFPDRMVMKGLSPLATGATVARDTKPCRGSRTSESESAVDRDSQSDGWRSFAIVCNHWQGRAGQPTKAASESLVKLWRRAGHPCQCRHAHQRRLRCLRHHAFSGCSGTVVAQTVAPQVRLWRWRPGGGKGRRRLHSTLRGGRRGGSEGEREARV